MRDYYLITNEELEAIVNGLDVNENDIVLAVAGSGDQAFALLEYAKEIKAVDCNPSQIEHLKKRIEFLKNKDFEKFLEVKKSLTKSLSEILERRNKYFRKNERLEKICNKLDSLKFKKGNIFQVAQKESFNKLYLSNVPLKEEVYLFEKLLKKIPSGSLIYYSHGKFFENIFLKYKKEIPSCLKLDMDLTNKARKIQEGKLVWKPSVYKKV